MMLSSRVGTTVVITEAMDIMAAMDMELNQVISKSPLRKKAFLCISRQFAGGISGLVNGFILFVLDTWLSSPETTWKRHNRSYGDPYLKNLRLKIGIW